MTEHQPALFASGFVPARSKLEAVTRLSALTGSPPETLGPGSKERKSVLVNLAGWVGISVPDRLPKPQLGALIAESLSGHWDELCSSTGDTITLVGLNQLLALAEAEAGRRDAAIRSSPALIESRRHEFVPARGKLEAVARMSALVDAPPEHLGPGSKERKSALSNLALALELNADVRAAKPELGRQMASRLDVSWYRSCWSAGQTITLEGLNRLLQGAERELWRRQPPVDRPGPFADARSEAVSLLEVIAAGLPTRFDGVACVEDMLAGGSTNWAQDEWPGFYFEYVGLPACINAFGGGPVTYANTRFDYSLGEVWDLKVHTAGRDVAPLNAADAIDACLDAPRGVGFIVLSGSATRDEGDFREWFRQRRLREGKKPSVRGVPAAFERRSKVTFEPDLLEAFHVADRGALNRARADGGVKVMNIGRQPSGAPRRPKYSLDLVRARKSELLLAARTLPLSGAVVDPYED